MCDVFEEIFILQGLEPVDPTESARRSMRTLRRRFYEEVAVHDDPAGFAVALDGRAIRTPARRALAAPRRPLAEAIAAEWRAQTGFIDPATMPMTRLANTIIDGVATAPDEVADEIVKFLGSDLVCYRAATPEGLVVRQSLHWDPILAWAGAALGAVHAVTTLTGSALIALALASGAIAPDAAWAAAHVDEDWNMEFWGRDELGLKRRAYRFAEMTAAAQVLAEEGLAG